MNYHDLGDIIRLSTVFTVDDVATQTCTTCKIDKPLVDFYERTKGSGSYHRICKECSKAYSRKRHATKQANSLEYREQAQRRSREHKARYGKDYFRRKQAEYRRADPDRARENWRASTHKRKAALRNAAENSLTAEEWQVIVAAFQSRCLFCGEASSHLQMDHVIPVKSALVINAAWNIVPACASCNNTRKNKPVRLPHPSFSGVIHPFHEVSL